MKLTKATDEELEEFLYPDLNQFLSEIEYLANNTKSSEELDLSSNSSYQTVKSM